MSKLKSNFFISSLFFLAPYKLSEKSCSSEWSFAFHFYEELKHITKLIFCSEPKKEEIKK